MELKLRKMPMKNCIKNKKRYWRERTRGTWRGWSTWARRSEEWWGRRLRSAERAVSVCFGGILRINPMAASIALSFLPSLLLLLLSLSKLKSACFWPELSSREPQFLLYNRSTNVHFSLFNTFNAWWSALLEFNAKNQCLTLNLFGKKLGN